MSTNWVRSHRGLLGSDKKVEKILVIGGAGHVCLALVSQLLSLGYRVRVLDRHSTGANGAYRPVTSRNLEVICGDFSDLNTVVAAMSGMDTVVHLGDVLSDPGLDGNDELLLEANRFATRLVGSCAKAVNVQRFIFASSCSVYGTASQTLDETSDLKPSDLYARAKVAAESELTRIASKKFQPVILRMGTTYGGAGRSRFNDLVSYMASVSPSPMGFTLAAPDRAHPFVHVEDVVRVIELILDSPEQDVCGQIYNVGSECQNVSLVEVAEMIQRQTDFGPLKIVKSAPAQDQHRIEFAKVRSQLGFEPKWTLEAGVRQVVQASRAMPVNAGLLRPSGEATLTEEIDLRFVSGDSASAAVGKGLVF